MAIAAHDPSKSKTGIPQGVAKEFNAADAKTGILRKKKKKGNPVPAGEQDNGGY
jgi:hypothetical protein